VGDDLLIEVLHGAVTATAAENSNSIRVSLSGVDILAGMGSLTLRTTAVMQRSE
jgi:hypothetical protein